MLGNIECAWRDHHIRSRAVHAAKRERKKTSYADDDDWRPSKNRSLSRGAGKGSRSGGGDEDSDEDYEDEEPAAAAVAPAKAAAEASEAEPDEKLRLKAKDIKYGVPAATPHKSVCYPALQGAST